MKKLVIIASFLLFFASSAWAGPWLLCNPAPAEEQVTHVRIMLDGTVLPDIPYEIGPNTGKVVVYDIGTLDDGAHEFNEVRFVNVRGQSEPLPFSLPAIPSLPGGLVLSADK